MLRYILAQACVEYEDNRIEPEKWAEAMPGKLATVGKRDHELLDLQALNLASLCWSSKEL